MRSAQKAWLFTVYAEFASPNKASKALKKCEFFEVLASPGRHHFFIGWFFQISQFFRGFILIQKEFPPCFLPMKNGWNFTRHFQVFLDRRIRDSKADSWDVPSLVEFRGVDQLLRQQGDATQELRRCGV